MSKIPISFSAFLAEWLTEVTSGNPSTTQLGNHFAHKLITQWLDIDDTSDELIYCDGAGDGGIDVAYLQRSDSQEEEQESAVEGDRWYLIQSKYGKAFQGVSTLFEESHKVIETLEGHRQKLSSLSADLIERIQTFRRQASDLDRIVLVFATVEPLNEEQHRVLDGIRAMGRSSLGTIFDVEAVSVDTIYQRALEDSTGAGTLTVSIHVEAIPSGADLLVGAVSLTHLYEFLKAYRNVARDLDQIYEKNVRKFLGSRRKVNRVMRDTLLKSPEQFGLFNNGITIVVNDFHPNGDGSYTLTEPYIVNGCQTTRTIWEVCHQRLDAGGTGHNTEMNTWRNRLANGSVVTKIVKVGNHGEQLLLDITRYTNSQNAIREKDFLALRHDFKGWATQMSQHYDIFLEIQRGGWESQKAYQKQHPASKQFAVKANAFDLLKVYGAGWMGYAGVAFGKNSVFLPNGRIFKEIMEADTEEPFDVEDLYAAFLLQQAADGFGFGRGAEKSSRRQTRFLFYMVTIELLKDILLRMNSTKPSSKTITLAVLKLATVNKQDAWTRLLDNAIQVIDEYLTQGKDLAIFTEPAYSERYNADLNAFLKADKLGHKEQTPQLEILISDYQRLMSRGAMSDRKLITSALEA